MVAVGAYVGAQVIANVTSVKIGSTFDRAVDMGTFVYPITFTLRDVVHKTLGKRLARTVVLTAAGVNLFLAAYLQWVVGVRPDTSFTMDDEFGPSGRWAHRRRLVVAKVTASCRTEVYHCSSAGPTPTSGPGAV